jgi:protein TonB
MFDYMTGGARQARSARFTTTAVSAMAHVVVLVALVIPALYATDVLPEPKEAMAFFVSAPPPPPPPPPAAPVIDKPAPAKPTPRTAPARPVAVARPVPAAPVEAPKSITPETGFETEGPDVVAEAGFEGGIAGGIVSGVVGGIVSAAPPPPPPPPPAPRGPIRVGGDIQAPRLIHRVEPEYPLIAQHAQIQGIVILEATVDRHGRVDEVRVLRSHSFLNDAAVAAVRQWRYEPLMLNGEPQPFVLTVTVSFSIPGSR